MRFLLRTLCLCLWIRLCGAATTNSFEASDLLDEFIQREMRDKGITGVAIALVDDQRIVWSHGYGVAKLSKIPASDDTLPTNHLMQARTPIRAGSVSKLFTSILVMREVEAGRLDLDEPITKYLLDFHPTNDF